ncbi:hypothetical protein PTTG_26671 [Puccinia triticina 1-1 BBBD Race 1]|uniref:Helicase C-terminal domain-containing protein n=1 Tax=Puccinia triticina (isolate 1-1 / race 1 (BBBD)) TaxID=630390 RepID=A0A180GSZ0_PUCT1|nr:hypothetical protein PTTG_26671 [Puccinia triticina 1-1 BBBD Race 1]
MDVLQLPPKVEEKVGLPLPEPWDKDYRQRYHNFAKQFGVDRGSKSWDSAEFFQQLTTLRLYCDHPALVDQSQYDLPKQQTSWHDSPKIVHLIGDLKAHLRSEQGGQIAKAVVFSQWTHFLGIVGVALVKNRIDFEQIDGTCSLQQRKKALARIRQQSNVQVLLATIGACGVGIDLTCTQKVYLMADNKLLKEPCWNPSVESQATDRAYWLGQVCTTRIICYFIEGSIEVNMIEIQKQKKELAQRTVRWQGIRVLLPEYSRRAGRLWVWIGGIPDHSSTGANQLGLEKRWIC